MSNFNPNISTRNVLIEKYKWKPKQNFRFPILEPILENRFCVYFPEIFEIESFLIQKITAPKLRLIANEYQWNNITISFIDAIAHSISEKLLKITEFCKIQKKNPKTDKTLFSFRINNLDATGLVVQSIIIDVKDVISVNLGESDYGRTKLKMCHLILKPLNCRIE